jgi:AcrR family transcriptional regulator
MEMYGERGFESTTVAEIAERAGLTERTFFRYFADKREVLFWGAHLLQELLVTNVEGAPRSLPPFEAITEALIVAADDFFAGMREYAKKRQLIILANPELQERELIKMASLASSLSDVLRRRGCGDSASSLASEAGIAVFKIAFDTWIHGPDDLTLSRAIRDTADELGQVTGCGILARRR